MRNSELKDFAPEIVKRMNLPEDRAKDLKKRVRATDLASRWMNELFQRFMQDAFADQEEAWDECAQLFGFKNLDDVMMQGYAMTLYGDQLQLRRVEDQSVIGRDD